MVIITAQDCTLIFGVTVGASSTMNRLYTFGCSFTSWRWPTWADILGQEFDYYENWGKPGAGNHYIFNSLNECITNNTLGPGDTVVIMWTNVMREDRYVKNNWLVSAGSLNSSSHGPYDESFVRNYVDERGFIIRDLAYINAAKHILENLGVNYIFLSMVPLIMSDMFIIRKNNSFNDVTLAYKPVLDIIRPSIYEKVFKFNWYSRPFTAKKSIIESIKSYYNSVAGSNWPSFDKFQKEDFTGIKQEIINEVSSNKCHLKDFDKDLKLRDAHPTPLEHLEYLEMVMPEFKISDKIRAWTELQDDLAMSTYIQTVGTTVIPWSKEIKRW